MKAFLTFCCLSLFLLSFLVCCKKKKEPLLVTPSESIYRYDVRLTTTRNDKVTTHFFRYENSRLVSLQSLDKDGLILQNILYTYENGLLVRYRMESNGDLTTKNYHVQNGKITGLSFSSPAGSGAGQYYYYGDQLWCSVIKNGAQKDSIVYQRNYSGKVILSTLYRNTTLYKMFSFHLDDNGEVLIRKMEEFNSAGTIIHTTYDYYTYSSALETARLTDNIDLYGFDPAENNPRHIVNSRITNYDGLDTYKSRSEIKVGIDDKVNIVEEEVYTDNEWMKSAKHEYLY